MKAFLDTNVLIDIVAHRVPFYDDSRAVYALCVNGEVDGVVTDLTICDLAYILRKHVTAGQLRACLNNFASHLKIIPVGAGVIEAAIRDFTVDFEDAVQLHAAQAEFVDCIVTRNVRHFTPSNIRVCTPTEFLCG